MQGQPPHSKAYDCGCGIRMSPAVATLLPQRILEGPDEVAVPWKELTLPMDIGCLDFVFGSKILV
jgi:hypothetical protein